MTEEFNLYLLTYHPNPTATTLGRAHTNRKDGYILGETQGEATGPLELYRQYKTPIGKYCQNLRDVL
jgi:hypothetical protein